MQISSNFAPQPMGIPQGAKTFKGKVSDLNINNSKEASKIIDDLDFILTMKNPMSSPAEKQEVLNRRAMKDVYENLKKKEGFSKKVSDLSDALELNSLNPDSKIRVLSDRTIKKSREELANDKNILKLIDEVIFEMQLKNPNISTAEKQEILARKAMADVTKNMRAVVKDYFNNLLSKLKK